MLKLNDNTLVMYEVREVKGEIITEFNTSDNKTISDLINYVGCVAACTFSSIVNSYEENNNLGELNKFELKDAIMKSVLGSMDDQLYPSNNDEELN